MNFGIKVRLATLGLAMGLMGALIVLITLNSQRQAAELRTRLSQLDSESLGIAEHFKDTLREVNDKLVRYRTARDPASWKEFLEASHGLDLWIDEQKPKLNTQHEKDVLQQIDAAYDDYLHSAQELHDKTQPADRQNALPANPTDSLAPSRRRLFDLGQNLVQAHFDLRNQLLTHASQTLGQLRLSVLGLLSLLFLFGIALAVMVYRDMITPLRVKLVESQALVEQHEKLASLGLLAAGVAHEIRNPLTAVKAALFTQQKKFQPGTPEHSDVKIVEREILRLERIVNDFLQFARPAEPEPMVIAADLLLLETKHFFAPQLAKNNIQINLEPGPPLHVKVDPGQMKQVLVNLVQNAADSIGRDGTITLRARQSKKPLLKGERNAVLLEVTDTGRGIPPEAQKRLFDPFFTTKENGTGLGLSIAARIVQKHGGVLQYQTQTNHGTTFEIVLPQAKE